MKFVWPLLILYFTSSFVHDLFVEGNEVLTLFGLMWVSGLGLAGCFILYRRASEVWITEDSVVVRWLRKERRIAFKEIEEVKFSHGCPVTLKIRNGKDVFFFPRGVSFPFGKPKIVKQLDELTKSNQADLAIGTRRSASHTDTSL